MGKKKEERIRYYTSETQDFVESPDQNYKVPENYKFIRTRPIDKFIRWFLYGVFRIIAFFYGKCKLHIKIIRSTKLNKEYKNTGVVIYGNHTQTFGDTCIPILVCAPKKGYTICSASNLKVPVIGKLLPWIGALPIPSTLEGMKSFTQAVDQRLKEHKAVLVYPEAHVWPYCSFIRNFPSTSFCYPVDNNVPTFVMTTTYQKRKHSDKPKVTIYLDGPYYVDTSLSSKNEQKNKLRDEVYNCMVNRSKVSTYEYIKYRPLKEKDKDE